MTHNIFHKKLLKSGGWVTFGSLVVRALELARSVILARLLAPETFGLMGVLLLVFKGLDVLTQTGFGAALIYRQQDVEEAVDSAWVISILRGVVLMVVLALSAPLVAWFYREPALQPVLVLFSISFLVKGLQNIHTVIQQKNLDFRNVTFIELGATLVSFVAAVTLAVMWQNIWALGCAQFLYYLVYTLLSFLLIDKRPRFSFNKVLAKELICYGKFVTGAAIVIFLVTEMDNAVVGRICGMQQLGFYTLAYSLANIPSTHITSILGSVLFPAYSTLQNDRIQLKATYIISLKLVSGLIFPAVVGLALLAPEIVLTIYGEKWLPSVISLQVLCIFGFLRSLGATTGPVFSAIGKPQVVFYLNVVKILFIALGIVPITAKYGIVGASIMVTVPMVAEQFFLWSALKSAIGVTYREVVSSMAGAMLGSVVMGVCLLLLKYQIEEVNVQSLVLLIMVGVLVYMSSRFSYVRCTVASIRRSLS